MKRHVVAIITDALGDRVLVGESELAHAIKEHFEHLPSYILLELIEKILREPTVVYEERSTHQYYLFYRLENGKYLVIVVKKGVTGTYFSTIYPTGKTIRKKHAGLQKVKV